MHSRAAQTDLIKEPSDKLKSPPPRSHSVSSLPSTCACFAVYISSSYLHLSVCSFTEAGPILMELQVATVPQTGDTN
jgi:hypothetical protein